MQLAFVQSYNEQVVADRMRFVAKRMQPADHFVELAVDEAVMTYRATGCEATAINAGVESIHAVFKAEAENDPNAGDPEAHIPCAWIENGFVIAGLFVLALIQLLIEARVFQ